MSFVSPAWAVRLLWALVIFLSCLAPFLSSAENRGVVYLLPIRGVIDLGLAPFVERVIREAEQDKASAIILDIDTLGGRVDAAIQIRDSLLGSNVPSIAFINRRAISAGALISLAAGKIAMAESAAIGAAAPVAGGDLTGAPASVSEKTISYVRTEFRVTAEKRNRPALTAEAMVDADVEIPGVTAKGKLLTLTTDEALKQGIADFRSDSLDSVLNKLDLAGSEVRRADENWAELLVRLLTHPIASSLLMTIGLLGVMIEIRTPGFGVPGFLGLGSLALFFWGHWLVRLAGWEELLLLAVGLILLALEIFVIPGFGVAGVLGILSVGGGLTLSLVGAGTTWSGIIAAVGRVSLSFLAAIVIGGLLLMALPRLPFGRSFVLQTSIAGDGSSDSEYPPWIGMSGTAISPLRPAGIADIAGQRLDVVSDGEMIEPGEWIKVTRVDGNRIVVRRSSRPQEFPQQESS